MAGLIPVDDIVDILAQFQKTTPRKPEEGDVVHFSPRMAVSPGSEAVTIPAVQVYRFIRRAGDDGRPRWYLDLR